MPSVTDCCKRRSSATVFARAGCNGHLALFASRLLDLQYRQTNRRDSYSWNIFDNAFGIPEYSSVISPLFLHVELFAVAKVGVAGRIDGPDVQDILPRAGPASPTVQERDVEIVNAVRPAHDLFDESGRACR